MAEGTSGDTTSRESMKAAMMELLSEVPALKALIDKPAEESDRPIDAEGGTSKLGAAARVEKGDLRVSQTRGVDGWTESIYPSGRWKWGTSLGAGVPVGVGHTEARRGRAYGGP